MTGWWQIHGRSDKPMHLHTEDDLYYVQHYSIWLDLQILVTTVWVVIKGKGGFIDYNFDCMITNRAGECQAKGLGLDIIN